MRKIEAQKVQKGTLWGHKGDIMANFMRNFTITSSIIKYIKVNFFKLEWNEIFDFIEFVFSIKIGKTLLIKFKEVFEEEFVGYKTVIYKIISVTDEREIEEIEKALSQPNRLDTVEEHLKKSRDLLSNKRNPDFANSIKESICAAASLSRIIIDKIGGKFEEQ